MLRFATIVIASALLSAAPAMAAEDDGSCYDAVVVGKLLDTSNFASLNDILPPPDGDPAKIWLGGYSDFGIRVQLASGRKRVPSGAMTVRVITASAPGRNSTLTFFLQKEKDGRWFAVQWGGAEKDWLGRYVAETDDGLRPCATRRRD